MSLIEGWWRKKGKSKLKKDKPKYFILGKEFLDWYTKPGAERSGSIGLDRLYIRISADKKELLVGDTGNSKEMTLTNDQPDVTAKVKEWFDAITLAIDAVRERKKASMSSPSLNDNKPVTKSSDTKPADIGAHKADHSPRDMGGNHDHKAHDSHSHSSHPINPYADVVSSHTVTSQDSPLTAHVHAMEQGAHEREEAERRFAKQQADMMAQKLIEQQNINFATQKLNEISMNTQVSQTAALQATVAAQEAAAIAAQQQALADAALERARQVSSPYQTQQQYQQPPQQQQQQYQQTQYQHPQPQQQAYQQTVYQQPQQQFQQQTMIQQQPQFQQTMVQQPQFQPIMQQPVMMQPVYAVQTQPTYVVQTQPMFQTVTYGQPAFY